MSLNCDCDAYFNKLKAFVVASRASSVSQPRRIEGVFVYNILKDGQQAKQWTVDLKSAERSIYEGPPRVAVDVTITVEDDDWVAITAKTLDHNEAADQGKLKVEGDVEMFAKLMSLI